MQEKDSERARLGQRRAQLEAKQAAAAEKEGDLRNAVAEREAQLANVQQVRLPPGSCKLPCAPVGRAGAPVRGAAQRAARKGMLPKLPRLCDSWPAPRVRRASARPHY